MEAKQINAVFGVLAFLGIFAALGGATAALIGTKLIGEERLARCFTFGTAWLFGGRGFARKTIIAAFTVILLYSSTLVGASLASHEWTLAPGAEKYFCEIDCHLAYSVTAVEQVSTIGSGPSAVKAGGNFTIISVRTRFDEKTISRHGGDFPLVPEPRSIFVVDDAGRNYSISEAGQEAIEAQGVSGTPMNEPLRPGGSYVSKLVFDLPSDANNSRVMILSAKKPGWVRKIVIGDEDSLLHKKVLFALPQITRR